MGIKMNESWNLKEEVCLNDRKEGYFRNSGMVLEKCEARLVVRC